MFICKYDGVAKRGWEGFSYMCIWEHSSSYALISVKANEPRTAESTGGRTN